MQWEFKPAMMAGKPVAVWVSLPFRFRFGGRTQATHTPVLVSREYRYPPAEDAKRDREPEPVIQPDPKYPEEALASNLEGTVYTKMWVDALGKVDLVIVTKSDNEVFNNAAMDAGRRWVFKPALLNGKPVAVWITVPFRFAPSNH